MKINKYLIIFSYDGSKFNGFQRQKNVRSVQEDIEIALSNILNENIVIKGSGRTDAGVHALMQCAHFETNIEVCNLVNTLNDILTDIEIINLKRVSENFHARYSVLEKTYEFKLTFDRSKDENYFLIYYKKLDIEKMKNACKLFEGTYDFRNFVSGYRDNYISTVFKASVKEEKDCINFKFVGKGFYKYMVRNLVGALIDVGRNKVSIDEINDMLINFNKRRQLSTAPANGLYLVNIKYEEKYCE